MATQRVRVSVQITCVSPGDTTEYGFVETSEISSSVSALHCGWESAVIHLQNLLPIVGVTPNAESFGYAVAELKRLYTQSVVKGAALTKSHLVKTTSPLQAGGISQTAILLTVS